MRRGNMEMKEEGTDENMCEIREDNKGRRWREKDGKDCGVKECWKNEPAEGYER